MRRGRAPGVGRVLGRGLALRLAALALCCWCSMGAPGGGPAAKAAAAAPCPCTIFGPTAAPAVADADDANAVELGVKFTADQNGYILGVRYYKGPANGGTHVGQVYNAAGALLASATFVGESASGWQQVTFASPLPISAGNTYVAAYHADSGGYAYTAAGLATGADSAPLHALADAAAGGNGVYRYSAAPAFPTQSYNATNYWVDVLFNSGPTDPDAPAISNVQATGIGATGATITWSTGTPANAVVQYGPSTAYGRATPLDGSMATGHSAVIGGLTPNTLYHYRVQSTDGGGNQALSGDFTFTTAALPSPDAGPGGPILVIGSSANPFSLYPAELLRAEGFDEFAVADISAVSAATLAGYDLAILGDMPLSAAQASLLSAWVQGGGNLIALHPDHQLAGLLGLAPAGGTLSDAYLLVDTSRAPGAGIVGQTIQYHGPADLYTLAGATAVATLYSNATTATGSPAVTLAGSGSGQAAAFSYDLARSVVYTRQGDPARAGQHRDGLDVVRSDDQYYGAAAADPRPDYVDLSRAAIPQADEQQRLLANLIEQMEGSKQPLPRFWYLPRGLKAAVVMTGDDHANGGTAGRWDQYLAASPAGCSVADWQCVRGTSYLYPNSPLSAAQAAAYTAQGFEVGLHVNTGCADWTPTALDGFFSQQLRAWAASYPSTPTPATERIHCVAWSDWADAAKTEYNYGIRLDTTYYYYPPAWMQNSPGYMTGSGLPMRLADGSGAMLDVYQAATQVTDESGQAEPANIDTLLNNATGAAGYYGVITVNAHTDYAPSAVSDAVVASAQTHGAAVISAKQLLTWVDGRNNSSFANLSWANNTVSFSVQQDPGARNLRAMLPLVFNGAQLTGISQNGGPVAFTTDTVKGIQYAFFPATSGAYQAAYGASGGSGGAYQPLPPARILDTRLSGQTLGPDGTLAVQISGQGGVPSTGVSAVVLNVAVTNATAGSYLSVWPAGQARPTASNLNWVAGETVPNLVEVAVGAGGQVDMYNAAGSVDLVVDVQGWVGPGVAGGLFNALAPARILDTRPSGQIGPYSTPLGAGETRTVQVAGQGGVPARGVSAVVLNVAVTDTTAPSYLTVWPAGPGRPTASNLNWVAGQTVPNRVIVPLGAGGQLALFNAAGSADLVIDVGGWFTDGTGGSGGRFNGLHPSRLLDTRQAGSGPALGPGETRPLVVTGRAGVPADAAAVVLNVAVTDPSAASYLTAWPDGQARPTASDLNWVAGETVPNLVIAKVGAGGAVDLYNALGLTDVVADVVGYYR